ncbi:ABC transporter substrate-binding protein [Roseomonas indoligenes]|uniref:ABC transporter substrate-binding protein n=1 Tax=Roseomonas indoligenes TaxID=2820811 RepID=A0A940S851_9PROT|nr:ABC transporter substrate-binding protein [Pararoseomonas indoligenes]MBP0495580.1 ABC transporter substrate-binding protein [Pararoseomonas indoligenes]
MTGASRLGRRAALGIGMSLAMPGLLRAQGSIAVTDLLGRQVRLPRTPRRIVLGQGRLLSLMGLLHPDPVSLLVGWASDLVEVFPDEYAVWTRHSPGLAGIPQLGRKILADFSLEAAVAQQPDLILLNRLNIAPVDARGRSEVLAKVESLGVPVAVIDCMADPMRDTLPSIAILGALLGREERARELSAFYAAQMQSLDTWLTASRPPVASVLLHNHGGGRECCFSIAQGSFTALIEKVRGRSIAADLLRTPLGQLHFEYVLTHPADVYVTTGGVYNGRGGVSLGAGIAPEVASNTLASMLAAQRLEGLPSVAAGRAFGIWHGFNETPQHLVALQALAGWLHPEAKERFDPRPTMDAFNTRFAAVPYEGTYWTGLRP